VHSPIIVLYRLDRAGDKLPAFSGGRRLIVLIIQTIKWWSPPVSAGSVRTASFGAAARSDFLHKTMDTHLDLGIIRGGDW